MATLLTVAQVREHVETDIGDDAVQRLVDDADAEIIRRLGPVASQVTMLDGGDENLRLPRKATAITAAVELYGDVTYTLDATDYTLRGDGYTLERQNDGTNPSPVWRGSVTITSTPVDETAQRKRLLVDLVKLAVAYDALSSNRIGDVAVQGLDYQAEREKLFRGLRTQGRSLIV